MRVAMTDDIRATPRPPRPLPILYISRPISQGGKTVLLNLLFLKEERHGDKRNMASEILSIPEENLKEVIAIIRTGIYFCQNQHAMASFVLNRHFKEISKNTIYQLEMWCKEADTALEERETVTPVRKK